MILSNIVTDAYRAYRGKTSNTPGVGSPKYIDIVAIINRKQREWASNPNVDWVSRYEQRAVGTLILAQQIYDIDSDVMRLSDYVLLTKPVTLQKVYVGVVKPQAITRYAKGCYLYGVNPQELAFIQTIDSSLAGYTITVPCFTMPPDMVNPTDFVACDSPEYLIYATAAELARNDYAKEEQYPNLNGIATTLYTQMVAEAQSNSFLQPDGVVNNMPQYTNSNMYQGYNGYTSNGN
jgi:hypothetical protein